jgi:hypothetical protein
VSTVNAPLAFGLEDGLDRAAYDALPEWLRNIVAKSPEYQRAAAPEMSHGSTGARLKAHLGAKKQPTAVSTTVREDLDDDIPY